MKNVGEKNVLSQFHFYRSQYLHSVRDFSVWIFPSEIWNREVKLLQLQPPVSSFIIEFSLLKNRCFTAMQFYAKLCVPAIRSATEVGTL